MSHGKSKRYLGLDLAGGKNDKTTLAVLEHYPKEGKTFLLDVYEKLGGNEEQSADEVLIETIREVGEGACLLGINVPIDLPPCVTCERKTCPLPKKCTVSSVQWMRNHSSRAFTPYTQRPIEVWIRTTMIPLLSPEARFEFDEAMGGNRAPLTVRLSFLKRHLKKHSFIEVWPKLSAALLSTHLDLPTNFINRYRELEDGPFVRASFLDRLTSDEGIFIYDRDAKKLAGNLSAFDSFLIAYTALLSDQNRTEPRPEKFPEDQSWIGFPQSKLLEENQ